MKIIEMGIVKDEAAQSSAEYVLILGGIIVIVLVAIIVYKNYVSGVGSSLNGGSEMNSVNGNLTQINKTLNKT
ncbi:class III signal peptide-containing protein [uncultured Methanobacterium sp.]|uniref:class III signal peptide-containing protein n=1 Tax=uncultured Methanobacterium sp. TaxID=176306 RepID=UPI002AA87D4D|nr:class III signal peptide-containing protein [uncultured Methanobacterium sp.]